MIRIPPNGFSGFAQATPAAQIMQGAGLRTKNGTRRRKRKASNGKVRHFKGSKRRTTKRPARLVKGSAAAKAYMAKIRKRRRR